MKQKKYKFVEVFLLAKIQNKNKFLLLKRSPDEIYPNIWQVITGEKEKGETAINTAIREIKEETNLNPKELYVVPRVNFIYLHTVDQIAEVPVFLAIIDTSEQLKLSSEHTEFKWCSYKESAKLLHWPTQIEALKLINKYWLKRKEKSKFVLLKIN